MAQPRASWSLTVSDLKSPAKQRRASMTPDRLVCSRLVFEREDGDDQGLHVHQPAMHGRVRWRSPRAVSQALLHRAHEFHRGAVHDERPE
jgi:hypothetical protein